MDRASHKLRGYQMAQLDARREVCGISRHLGRIRAAFVHCSVFGPGSDRKLVRSGVRLHPASERQAYLKADRRTDAHHECIAIREVVAGDERDQWVDVHIVVIPMIVDAVTRAYHHGQPHLGSDRPAATKVEVPLCRNLRSDQHRIIAIVVVEVNKVKIESGAEREFVVCAIDKALGHERDIEAKAGSNAAVASERKVAFRAHARDVMRTLRRRERSLPETYPQAR